MGAPTPGIGGSFQTNSDNTESVFVPTATYYGTSILIEAVPSLYFGGLAGGATILEATVPALGLRWGTNTPKCQQITGPGSSVYYPFFSHVWGGQSAGGVWMPMTYNHTQTATWQGSSTSSDSDRGVDVYGIQHSYSVPNFTADITSYTFSWGRSGSDRACTVVGAWSHYQDPRGDSSASNITTSSTSSTSFVIGSEGEDTISFYSTGAYAGNDQAYPIFVIGGTQWDDCDASAWLGPGRWKAMSIDSTGGTSTELIELDLTDTLMVTAQSDTAVVYSGLPNWVVRGPAIGGVGFVNSANVYLGTKFQLDAPNDNL